MPSGRRVPDKLTRRPRIIEPNDRPPAARNPSKPSSPCSARSSSTATRSSRSPSSSSPRTSTGRPTPRSTRSILDLFERREPIDIVTVSEALERDEDLEAIGGRAYLGTLSNATPDRGPRDPVRAHRRAQGGAAEPDRRRGADRRHRLRGSGRGPGGDRSRGVGAVRGQPAAGRGGLLAAPRPAPRRLRPARLPARAPRRDQRHPDGLRRPRRADHRAPEERPRDPRRPPVDRQDELRAQHRGARGRPRQEERRRLQPRDEQGAARAAPAVVGRQHRQPAAPDRASSRSSTSRASRRR